MTGRFQAAKLEDVARRAGVGNATASRALNARGLVGERTRLRVLEAARELNYRPNRSAQALKGGRSGMIGMIIPRVSDIFFASCVDAAQAMALRHSSLLVVATTHDSSDQAIDAIQSLLHHKVDGLILAISKQLTDELLLSLCSLPVPAVGIDAPLSAANIPSVLIDNALKARLATQHLIQHGYQSIVSVCIDPTLYTMEQRHVGYLQAVKEAGLTPKQSFIADQDEAEGLLRSCRDRFGRFALLAGNEDTAKLVLAAAKRLSMSMPDAFGMISFDDFGLADAMGTPLSVIRQPAALIGRAAARKLFARMQMQEPGDTTVRRLETVIQAELVVRQSCGCEASTDMPNLARDVTNEARAVSLEDG